MRSEIVVIGAGASGLMAAYHAARALVDAGSDAQVTVLEKMPRPARKVMITGKGRCNFTNVKDWNAFSGHIRSKANFVKSAFYNLPSQAVVDWFEGFGMQTVVERGDRAFPASHHASDVVDTLVGACQSLGVKIETEAEVAEISAFGSSPLQTSGCAGPLPQDFVPSPASELASPDQSPAGPSLLRSRGWLRFSGRTASPASMAATSASVSILTPRERQAPTRVSTTSEAW